MSSYWCFTLNNYIEEDVEVLKKIPHTYIIIGKELGEDKKTPHLQGYVELKSRARLQKMKKYHARVHWEQRFGTGKQASDYCKKDGDYIELGEIKINTEKITRKELRELAKSTSVGELMTNYDVSRNDIWTFEKLKGFYEQQRNKKSLVIWLHGKTGSGKSYLAHNISQQLYEPHEIYRKDKTKWWNHYDGHKCVIFDDFRASNIVLNELLNILDEYPMWVETKGGNRQLLAELIIITSPKRPELTYNQPEENITQLTRRIERVIELPDDDAIDKILVLARPGFVRVHKKW